MEPVNETLDLTGSLESWAKTSFIGLFKSIFVMSSFRCVSITSGKNWAGSVSSCSRKTPSLLIFAKICLSAAQETAIETGKDAPWRGSLMTRTS